MRRRRRIWAAGSGIVVIVAISGWWLASEPVRIHRGKDVREWMRQLGGDRAPAMEAKAALLEVGPELVPLIVAELKRTRPDRLVNQWPYVFFWEQLVTFEGVGKLRPSLPSPRSHWDMMVRRELFKLLGELGANAARAVPVLMDGTSDSYENIHEVAIEALGRIGPDARAAVPALAACLEDRNSDVRRAAALALSRIGTTDNSTLRRIKMVASETNEWVAAFAQVALWKLGAGPEYSSAVSNRVAKGDEEFRARFVSMLPDTDPPREETLVWLRERLRDPVESALVRRSALQATELLAGKEYAASFR